MRILYISKGESADYLCDQLFHGLRSLFGTDVVDANRLWFMYKDADPEKLKQQWGKGFTLYGLIDEGEVDRADLLHKIKMRFYDFIVYGSIHREWAFLYDVIDAYPKHRIIFIDGEDSPDFLRDVRYRGLYFKRELYKRNESVFPIEMGIPEEKLIGASRKSLMLAPLDPLDLRTYIYDDEKEYYDDYRKSLFAKTMKKGGWDCMRHYEILAAECLPYFQNLESCPETIMQNFPKEDLIFAKSILEYQGLNVFNMECGKELWSDINVRVQKVLHEKLTTKALAKYVLDTVSANA